MTRAGLLRDADHPAVDVGRYPTEHLPGDAAHSRGPVLAHQIVVAADAAAGHDHRRRTEFELAQSVS